MSEEVEDLTRIEDDSDGQRGREERGQTVMAGLEFLQGEDQDKD